MDDHWNRIDDPTVEHSGNVIDLTHVQAEMLRQQLVELMGLPPGGHQITLEDVDDVSKTLIRLRVETNEPQE